MSQNYHKKTKSLDCFIKGSRSAPVKQNNLIKINRIPNKNNLLTTTGINLSQNDYQNFKKKYIFEDSSLNYNDIKHDSDIVMADYKYDSIKSNETDNFEKLIRKDFSNMIIRNKSFSKSNFSPILESINDESQMKVLINNLGFNNPINAYGTIKKNKIIFDSMIKNYYEIQKKRYSELIKDLEYNEKFNKTACNKIKITHMASKNDRTNILSNNNDEIKEMKERRKNFF
jgi:hypothetical protein